MSKDAKNVPALRFKGYSDAWEKRKLGEISPLRGGFAFKSSEFKDKGIPIIRISNIKSDGKVGGDFVYYHEQEVDQSYLLPQRAALLAMSGATTGKVAILHKQHEGKYYQNQRVGYFSKVKDASYSFISVLIRSDLFLKQLKSVLVAGAQPNVSSKEIDQFIFSVPVTLNEQEKIGAFFEYLDSLIAATQHKIDALEQVKKALLQRLFDQSWRFDGYLETWKKYRLGDHAEILTGGTPKTSVAEYWEPKSIPWMSSGEVNKVYLDQTDTMISLEGFKNSSARWVKKHSILIALAGQGKTRGTVAVNNIALTTNQSIAAIIPGKDLYYEFVFQNLTNRYNELRLISSGDGTRGGLNKQIVSDVTIHSPNLNEQIRIGKLLSKVDHLSTENQLKLSRIELIKKYLLQTLFI